tara:strand:- start:56 stop:172 length:117 start_codon:yes stop_codon:yes gene_type:complete
MTIGYGIGMFFYGLGILIVGSLIALYVINKFVDKDDER